MKRMKKIVPIIIMIILIMMTMSTVLLADYTPTQFKGQIDTDADTGKVKTTGGKIVGIIQVVGTIVAVGMLMVLGIKYMMGSAEERAEYKKTMFPYVVGAVLIFAAGSLTQMIYSWAIKL